MSMPFPRLDLDSARHSLQPGRWVLATDASQVAAIRVAEQLGLISTRTRCIVLCVNRRDPDYRDRPIATCSGIIEVPITGSEEPEQLCCPECGEPIDSVEAKQQFQELGVTELLPAGVLTYLERAIRALGIARDVTAVSPASLLVRFADNRQVRVVVLDWASPPERATAPHFAEPVLNIVASPNGWPEPTVFEEAVYAQLAEVLSYDENWFAERLQNAANPLHNRPSYSLLEAAFETMLLADKGWQSFEQEFVPALFNRMANSGQLIARYLAALRRCRGTVLDCYTVPIGGAGRTDMRQISKFEIMNELCEGNSVGDAKRLIKSDLTTDDIKTIFYHLENDPSGPKRAVILVARKDVPASVWAEVTRLRGQKGFWQMIVLTRPLILELVAALEATDLLPRGQPVNLPAAGEPCEVPRVPQRDGKPQ